MLNEKKLTEQEKLEIAFNKHDDYNAAVIINNNKELCTQENLKLAFKNECCVTSCNIVKQNPTLSTEGNLKLAFYTRSTVAAGVMMYNNKELKTTENEQILDKQYRDQTEITSHLGLDGFTSFNSIFLPKTLYKEYEFSLGEDVVMGNSSDSDPEVE
jgi:hypothetical protein